MLYLSDSAVPVRHGLLDERNDGFNTIGIAYVSGVCDDLFKSAICQHKPGYGSLYILAHEIGHK